MTEWDIVKILIELVGFFFVLGRPIINVSQKLTRIDAKLDMLSARSDENEKDKEKIMLKLDNHETRLIKLECDNR